MTYPGGVRDPNTWYACIVERFRNGGTTFDEDWGEIVCAPLFWQHSGAGFISLPIEAAAAAENNQAHRVRVYIVPPRGIRTLQYHCIANVAKTRAPGSGANPAGNISTFNGTQFSTDSTNWALTCDTPPAPTGDETTSTSNSLDVSATFRAISFDNYWSNDPDTDGDPSATVYFSQYTGFDLNLGAGTNRGFFGDIRVQILAWESWAQWLETNDEWVPPPSQIFQPFPHPPLGEFMRQRLFLLSPATILTATVWTDPDGYPLDRLFIENLSGSVLLARPGMTVAFGETPGGSQLGRSYIRRVGLPISGGAELYIGRSSRGRFTDGEVDLFAGAHVTVWDDYRVWSKMQVIVTEGDQNEETGIWPVKLYKDSDLLPGSRTNTPPPVANGGPGWASTIDPDTEVITVTFESTSIAVADGATITGVLWDVADGTITLGTDTDNIMQATFPAGFRWVHLTATDSNGNSHMCHIPVFARDPENDLTIPAWQFEGQQRITASGQQLNVRILSAIPFAQYPGGTLAMIWEGEPESPNVRNHMSFIGWHANDPAQISIQPTAALRDSTLELVDVAGRLAALAAFSQEVTNTKTSDANTWFEMRAANVWKFLHYLLQWHSTALDLADWHPLFRPDEYTFTVLGADGGNLFDQINNLARMIVPDCALTCNTKGQLYIRPDILLQPFEERNEAVAWNLQPADWTDIRWRHQHVPRVRWLYGGAIIATDTPLVNPETGDEYLPTVFCRAPGETPGQGTEEVRNESQLALSQAELNVVEGHRYAILNSLESEFVITLAGGSLRGIEPADVRWVWLNIPPNVAAQRGFTAANLRGIVREINLSYEYTDTGTDRTVELTWQREVLGTPAVSYDVSGFPLPPPEPTPEPAPLDFLGMGDESMILRSDEGVWDLQIESFDPVDEWRTAWHRVAYSPALGKYVATGSARTLSKHFTAVSVDGVSWDVQVVGEEMWHAPHAIVWVAELGLFVCTWSANSSGIDSLAMTSPEGVAWTILPAPATNKQWTSLAWSPSLSLLVAGASGMSEATDNIMTSTNGTSWTLGTLPRACTVTEVIWVEAWGLFVAHCRSFTSPETFVVTSPDGAAWTERSIPRTGNEVTPDLAYSPELNLMISPCYDTDEIIVTNDGINWSRTQVLPAAGLWLTVAWSSQAHTFCMIEDIPWLNDMPPMMGFSSDGVDWTLLSPELVPDFNWRQIHHLSGLGQ